MVVQGDSQGGLSMGNIIFTVVFGVVGNLATLAAIWLFTKVSSSVSRRDPRTPTRYLPLLIAFIPILNTGFFFFIIATAQSIWWLLAIPLSLSILIVILWRQLYGFWNVGIRGVDREIAKGISHEDSLKLVHNKLKFLGIGASKLSRLDEFEAALVRCKKEDTIKLLLCNPTDKRLTLAAKRFNKPEDEYRNITIESLRRIAGLKKKRALNLEVHFYSEECDPVFRLMFIDDNICLFSYNIWGEGDGSQCPQLHVVNPPSPNRTVQSYYYPLEVYFDSLWSQACPWNFADYLG